MITRGVLFTSTILLLLVRTLDILFGGGGGGGGVGGDRVIEFLVRLVLFCFDFRICCFVKAC